MGFTERLRMASIYKPAPPPGPGVGAARSSGNPGFSPREIAQREERINGELANRVAMQDQMDMRQQANKPMDVKYDPYEGSGKLTPWQKSQEETARAAIDARGDVNDEKLDFAREKQAQEVPIRQQRADVYEWSKRNPSAKILNQPDGKTLAVHAVTGEILADFGSSGKSSDATKAKVGLENDLTRINTQAGHATDLAKLRQTGAGGALDQIAARTAGQIDVNEAKGQDPLSPTQYKVDQFNKIMAFTRANPEYAQFVKTKGNDFRFDVPEGDTETLRRLNDAISSPANVRGDIKLGQPSLASIPGANLATPPTGQPDEMVEVYNQQGVKGKVKRAVLGKTDAQGKPMYTVKK